MRKVVEIGFGSRGVDGEKEKGDELGLDREIKGEPVRVLSWQEAADTCRK